jgi:hypothetical protein
MLLLILKPYKMKTMKTFVLLKQNLLKSALFILVATSTIISNAKSSTGKPFFNTPVNKLAAFTVMLNNNNKVDLKWTTEIETNLSHIMVEKSIDGKNFKEAALVFTYGNTTARSEYAFADNVSKIKSGPVYYRLRIVDVDGTTQYSDTRIIEISK